MSIERGKRTLADFVAIVVSPVLIMVMVRSLVSFLIDILYSGDFTERLNYILFWFIFGVVLIARVGMDRETMDRKWLYAPFLCGATFVGLMSFVQYPSGVLQFAWLVNIGFIALIWWSSHKLTYDCTYEGDSEEETGTGILDAAGLDSEAAPTKQSEEQIETLTEVKANNKNFNWFERWQNYRVQQHKKRIRGLWVVYFSLAALPIFGFGQSLIDAGDLDRRQHAFWMMVCYVASGLGLLCTTCFIGLRQYMRKRRLEMPKALVGVWLGMAALLIVGTLIVGAVLPRPNAEYPTILGKLTSPERKASKYAVKSDSPAKDGGRESSDPKKAERGEGSRTDGKGGPKGDGKSSKQGGEKSQGKQSGKDKSKDGKSGEQKDKSDDKSDQNKDDRDQDKDSNKSDDKRDSSSQDNQRRDSQQREGSKQPQSESKSKNQSNNSEEQSSSSSSTLSSLWQKFSTFLRWIVYIAIAVVAVYAIGKGFIAFLKHMANFTTWAKNLLAALQSLWASLFGWMEKKEVHEAVEQEEVSDDIVTEPFAAYPNPFETGLAERMPPAKLVRYSFEALQAWAREFGAAREEGETPLEFVSRLGNEAPALEKSAGDLAGLYVRVAYAQHPIPASSVEVVRDFWTELANRDRRPMTARVSTE